MVVEYTGRQAAVTEEMRVLTAPFLERMEKMLGAGASAHVIVTTEKHRQIAEVTVKSRAHDIVGMCESTAGAESALRQALEKTEAQAVRFKEKRATQKRLPKDEKALVETALERGGKAKRTALLPVADSPLDTALGSQPDGQPGLGMTKLYQNGHTKAEHASSFSSEPHVRRSIDAVAMRPMSVEEAVKELETRNREIFVFRDKAGLTRILHCKRNGELELIELP
jgi:putative sigma-54 modulation protein